MVDAGAAGLWTIGQVPADLVAPEVGTPLSMISFAPTTATAVWTALAELAALPVEHEVFGVDAAGRRPDSVGWSCRSDNVVDG